MQTQKRTKLIRPLIGSRFRVKIGFVSPLYTMYANVEKIIKKTISEQMALVSILVYDFKSFASDATLITTALPSKTYIATPILPKN